MTTVQITIPAPSWLWLPIVLVIGWGALSLQTQAHGYRAAKDTVEHMIQSGKCVWLAPEADTVRRKPGG